MKKTTKLTVAHLKSNKPRTLSTIFGISLSCVIICSIFLLLFTFREILIDSTINMNGDYHAEIILNDIKDLDILINNDKIDKIETFTIDGFAYNNLNQSKEYLEIYNKSDYSNNRLKLISGNYPKSENEIIIPSNILNVSINDIIEVEVGDRYEIYIDPETGEKNEYLFNYNENAIYVNPDTEYVIKDTTTLKLKVVGKYESESNNNVGYTVYKYTKVSTDLLIKAKSPKDIYNIVKDLEDNNIINSVYYNNMLLTLYGVGSNEITITMFTIGGILFAVVIFVSVLVVYNSFSISYLERNKEIGILRSIGATTKQIRSMVYKEAIILTIIAIPLGIIVSLLGIYITLNFINSNTILFGTYAGASLKFIVNPFVIIGTIILTTTTVFISALIPAFIASKTSPIEAIRSNKEIKIKGKKIKTSKLSKKLYGTLGNIALKNFKRSKGKYRITIIAISISIILFFVFSTTISNITQVVKKEYGEIDFNMIAYGVDENNIDIEEFKKTSNTIKEVEKYRVIKYAYLNTTYDLEYAKSKNFFGMDDYDILENELVYMNDFDVFNIDQTLFTDEYLENVLLNNDYISDYGSTYKDTVIPRLIVLEDNDYNEILKSEGIKNTDNIDALYYNLYYDTVNNVDYNILKDKEEIVVPLIDNDLYLTKISKNHFVLNTIAKQSTITLFISNSDYQKIKDVFLDGIDVYFECSNANKCIEELEKDFDNLYFDNIEIYFRIINDMFLLINVFTIGFISLLTLIGLVNIFNTLYTNVLLRKREFLIFKTIGMTNKQLNRLLLFETLFYALKSLFYGISISLVLSYLIYLSISMSATIFYVFPIKEILICVIPVFLIIYITMMYSIRLVKKQTDIANSVKTD